MGTEETIQLLESRLKDNPKSILFARLADLYLKRGEIDRAIDLCEEGIQHHPAYVTGNYILGKAYIAKGLHDKAESELKKVLTHDRHFLSAHKLLGDIMARMGWENKAAIHYKDLLRIDPMDDYAQQMLDTISPGETMLKEPVPDPELKKEALPRFETEPQETAAKDWTAELDDLFIQKTHNAQDISVNDSERTLSPEISEIADEKSGSETEILFVPEETAAIEPEEIVLVPPAETEERKDESPSFSEHEEPSASGLEIFEAAHSATSSGESSESRGLLDDELDQIFPEQPESADKEKADATSQETPSDTVAQPSTESLSSSFEDHLREDTSIVPGDKMLDSMLDDTLKRTGEKDLKKPEKAPLIVDMSPDESSKAVETGKTIDTESTETVKKGKAQTSAEDESNTDDNTSEKRIISPTLGEIYAAQGQYSKAVKVYEMLIQKKPESESKYSKKIDELKKKMNP